MDIKTHLENTSKKNDQDIYKNDQKSNTFKTSRETAIKSKTAHKISSKTPNLRIRRRLVNPESKKEDILTMINTGPVLIAPISSVPPVMPLIPQFYTLFPQPYIYPVTVNPWNAVLPVSSTYTLPVSLMFTPPITPSYSCFDGASTSLFSPIMAVKKDASELTNRAENPVEHLTYKADVTNTEETENKLNAAFETNIKTKESIENYLNLPKKLFPTAKTLPFDPNSLINEFCKICNLKDHILWILDLEFGIPKYPTRRLIAMYNVKYNSVNCKNAPEAIHPGFEECCQDFKRAFLFYYDGIISNWYRGYTIMYNDKSVENFQEWICKPMQKFGMCWA